MSSDFCFQQYIYDENGKPKQLEANKEERMRLSITRAQTRRDRAIQRRKDRREATAPERSSAKAAKQMLKKVEQDPVKTCTGNGKTKGSKRTAEQREAYDVLSHSTAPFASPPVLLDGLIPLDDQGGNGDTGLNASSRSPANAVPSHNPPNGQMSPNPQAGGDTEGGPPSPVPSECQSGGLFPCDDSEAQIGNLLPSAIAKTAAVEQVLNGVQVSHPTSEVNYAQQILGYEVSALSPTVKWACGVTTTLPYIAKEDDPSVNILTRDEKFVLNMAKASDTSSVRYIHCAERNRKQAIDLAREELSRGNTVVLQHRSDAAIHEGAQFNAELFREVTGYAMEGRGFSIHDAEKRVSNPEAPHILGCQLKDMLASVEDHRKIRCILDMPGDPGLVPPIISALDDAYRPFKEVRDVCPVVVFPQDMADTRSWFLAHTGAFLTYPHKDADGFMTYLEIYIGGKMWVVYRPSGYTKAKNRNELNDHQEKFKDKEGDSGEPSGFGIEYDEGCERTVIHVQRGDLLIMPPGVFHAVYTPIRGLAHGGHLLVYNALHLTEASRAYDHQNARYVTNTDHASVRKTLAHMAIALIRQQDSVFHKKPIIALCLMVKYPSRYEPNTSDPQQKEHAGAMEEYEEMRCSLLVVNALIDGLGLNPYLPVNGRDYLFEGAADWMDPGPIVDIAPSLARFQSADPFPKKNTRARGLKRKR